MSAAPFQPPPVPVAGHGFDVVVISARSAPLAARWQHRLRAGRGQVLAEDAVVVAVDEDWPGGAGNALGTLYALREADDRLGGEVRRALADGRRVAVYHTAGKGTRLAPLPGVEGNDKSAVKLPGLVRIDGREQPLTLLEAVLRQTAAYAPGRPGRASVFWGDQVFVPTVAPDPAPAHHADILCRMRPFPDADTWRSEGLDRYGLLAVGAAGGAAQLEKITHATAVDLVRRGVVDVSGGIGTSLGSFTLSAALVEALLSEFAPELDARRGSMDTDPHWWMPLTLDMETYAAILGPKGTPAAAAHAHWHRMRGLRARLPTDLGVLGALDVGREAWWWDFGALRAYDENLRRLLEDGPEADALRALLRVDRAWRGPGVDVDDRSVVVGGAIARGTIRNSVLVGVFAEHVDLDGVVLLDTHAERVVARGGLGYGIRSATVALRPREVLAEIVRPRRPHLSLRTTVDRDPADDWEVRLPGNPVSWAELHALNASRDG